jgi:hypothetical protein
MPQGLQLLSPMSQTEDAHSKVIAYLSGTLPLNDQITVVNRGE